MPDVHTPQSICRFGIARCDITPPVGIYHRLWGAATHDRATGVHRQLTATALIFQAQDGSLTQETEQVLVAVDHCLLWAREMDSLLGSVCETTGLAPEEVIVTFSHTHAAGLIGVERVHLPGGELIAPYLEELARKIPHLVEEARRAVQPVVISYGTGRCALAGHRDFWDEASRQFVCGFNPAGPTDDTVLVARMTGPDGGAVASVVNYACHPTTLAWANTLISPDFPGAMREVVERATDAPCVFLQGASGDLGPREGFVADPAVADRNGRQLGYAALAALESLPPPGTSFHYAGPVVSGATLGAWEHRSLSASQREQKGRWRLRRWAVELAYRPEVPTKEKIAPERAHWQSQEQAAQKAGDAAKARDCRAMVERMTRWQTRVAVLPPGEAFPLPIALWQIGDAFWLAVEGEHYNQLQRALRRRFPDLPIVLATLANGSRCTYLPTVEAYGKGIYQDSVAVLAAGCLEQLIDAIGRQIQDWAQDSAPCQRDATE
jgi:hypothetical protein